MKNICIFILLTSLCMATVSCNNKNMESMRTEFPWEPCVAAPMNYPAETQYGLVGYGNQGKELVIMEQSPRTGIGVASAGVGVLEDDPGRELPNSISILWLSYTEQKFYKADIKLSDELQARILQLFQEGYDYPEFDADMNWKTIHRTYDNPVVTLLPRGHIWLHLDGPGRTVIVCDTLKAQEVRMSLKEFDEDADRLYNTIGELCAACLKGKEGVEENLKQFGIPDGLWDTYKERFNYDIDITFEDTATKYYKERTFYKYVDGERNYPIDGVPVHTRSRLKKLEFEWKAGNAEYDGHFFLDEEEVVRIFSEAFGKDRQKKGRFIIKVSKYNNLFDIALRVDGKDYKFEKTKIHVFKVTPENKNDDDHLFYWNYRDESIKRYIGE